MIRAGLSPAVGLGACLGGLLLWAAAAQAQPTDELHQKAVAAAAKVQPAMVTIAASGGYSQAAIVVGGGHECLIVSTTKPLQGLSGQTYTVILQDGHKYPADLLMVNQTTDLAVWRLKEAGIRLPGALFAYDSLPQTGSPVIAVGPAGGELRLGIVSATNRELAGLSGLVQTDAPITSHSSGEALVNINGEVIGLITRLPNISLSNSWGLGFAVPASQIVKTCHDLTKNLSSRPPIIHNPPSGARHQDIVTAVNKIQPAMVTISSSDGTSQAAIIMDENEALVVSPPLSLKDPFSQTYTVTLQNRQKHAARLLMISPTTDLAVWQLEEHGIRLIEPFLGHNNFPQIGDLAIAAGPAGSESRWGVISATNRELAGLSGLIQTDAPLTSHSSGEALVNIKGELIGLITRVPNASLPNTQGLGFAVPASQIIETCDNLKKNLTKRIPTKFTLPPMPTPEHLPPTPEHLPPTPEHLPPSQKIYAYLGVELDDYMNFKGDRLPSAGCLITSVAAGGPAFRAGILPGDIIVRLDEKDTPNVITCLRLLSTTVAGGTVWLDVFRSGELVSLQMTLGGL